MNTAVNVGVVTVASPAGTLSLPDDFTPMEAGRLLEDVRLALTYDLRAASSAAGRLASFLANTLPEEPGAALSAGGLASWQKRKVECYIKNGLDEPLYVQDLANLVSLSANHFSRAFKVTFGVSPHAYITRVRIGHAKALMLATSDSLSHVALSCGFADQSHLCRAFRTVMGATPGSWRRNHAAGS